MPRHVLKIEGERHGFVNMISDKMSCLEPEMFVASRVEHPLVTHGEVIVDTPTTFEARMVIIRTCMSLVADCDELLGSLDMDAHMPPLLAMVAPPKVCLTTVVSE